MAVEFKLPDVIIDGDYAGEIEESNGEHAVYFIMADFDVQYSVSLNAQKLRAIADKLEELEKENA